jgi:hypothetical protein
LRIDGTQFVYRYFTRADFVEQKPWPQSPGSKKPFDVYEHAGTIHGGKRMMMFAVERHGNLEVIE